MKNGQHPAKARISKRDLGWLAGIIDGEGSINLSILRRNGQIIPFLEIGNTNVPTAQKATRIMKTLTEKSIRCYPKNSQMGYRPCWKVQATSHAAIKSVLQAVLPDLEGKRPQAELMLRYLSAAPGKGRGNKFLPAHYQMVSEMKHMNHRYAKGEWTAQRTTERIAPNKGEETV